MSGRRAADPAPHLLRVLRASARPGQPQPLFRALDAALDGVLGHRLFTILRHHASTGESERCYTNQPTAYPVGGRKALNPTAWALQVIHERRPYLGRTADDIRAVFFDHELIASLGCASVLNVPVVWDDRLLGTLNLLHEAHWYDEADIVPALDFASLAVPGFLALER
jgi:GAF domain-containing protein